MRGDIVEHRYFAGALVDVDDRGMAGEVVARRDVAAAGLAIGHDDAFLDERGLGAQHAIAGVVAEAHRLADRQPFAVAAHHAVFQPERACTQARRRERLQPFCCRETRLAHGMAAIVRATRTPGAHVERRLLAVHGEHLDTLERHTELLGRNLRQDGTLAGAGVGAAEAHADVAVEMDVDRSVAAVGVLLGVRAADMHGRGDADAPSGPALGALAFPADRLTRGFEALDQPRRAELRAYQRRLAGKIGVEAPDFDLIHAELVGELVHQAFERKARLRRAVAAELAAGQRGRVDQPPGRVQSIGAIQHSQRLQRGTHHRHAAVIVGAIVDIELGLDRAQAAVLVGVERHLDREGVPALGRGKLLLARKDQPHRPLRRARQGACNHLVLTYLGFGTEAATDADLVADDLIAPQVERQRYFENDVVRRLGRAPEVKFLFGFVPVRQRAVGFHAGMSLAREGELAPYRHRGGATAGLIVTPVADRLAREIDLVRRTLMQPRGARLQGGGNGDRRCNHLVVDADRAQCSFRYLRGLGGHCGHFLAHEAHDGFGHRCAIGGTFMYIAFARRQVGGGDDSMHARQPARRRRVDAENSRVTMRRTENGAVKNALQRDIGHVGKLSARAQLPVDAPDAAADLLHRRPPRAAAVFRIASTIPL